MNDRRPAISDIIVVGFAMFAVFFGAGNLIFPPYLGMESGSHWFLGFLCFFIADAGLAILTVLATTTGSGTAEGLLSRLGQKPAKLVSLLMILCIGPLVAVPRTCATVYEMAVLPLLPSANSWLFGLLFFALVLALTIRPGAVVDIIGRILTPMLLLTLLFLCAKGILSPVGQVTPVPTGFNVAKAGFLAGYQTMDVLGAVPITIVLLKSVADKGFRSRSQQFRVMLPASLVAMAGLFLVYCGLAYLGATTSLMDVGNVNQAGLVVLVTELLLKRFGVVLLGLIVFFACLTTAVGLTSSAADYFSGLTGGKVSYTAFVLMICGFGMVVSNVGISAIISLASPLLNVIYPVLLTQILLSFFNRSLRRDWIFRGAAIGAFVVALLDVCCELGLPFAFVQALPLHSLGLAWVLPAIVGGIAGAVIPFRQKEASLS